MQEVSVLVREAEKAFMRGKFDDVERKYIKALTINAGAFNVQAELAMFYLKTGREAKAEALYRELINFEDDASHYSNLGLAAERQGKYARACHAYEQSLKRDSDSPERMIDLGRVYAVAGRHENAVPILEKAAKRRARDVDLLHLLAESYLQMGLNSKATELYRTINKLRPYDEEVKAKISTLAQASF
jgi:tetratricopeptide (TPR) repeat protein